MFSMTMDPPGIDDRCTAGHRSRLLRDTVTRIHRVQRANYTLFAFVSPGKFLTKLVDERPSFIGLV
jgi:hypothetical protein